MRFTQKTTKTLLAVPALCASALWLVADQVGAQRPKFYNDDPIERFADTQDASGVLPKEDAVRPTRLS